MTISLLVIACNEEHRLAACVASARTIVDQVVIVVQESYDRTLEIARAVADVVIKHPCHGTNEPSRPAGLAACTGDWVIALDADEVLTDAGRAMLRDLPIEADVLDLLWVTVIGANEWCRQWHTRLFRPTSISSEPMLHSGWHPAPGARRGRFGEEPHILHAKTWGEQKADDARYARLGGHTRSALYPTRPFFRPGTEDTEIWDSVAGSRNEYQLPDRMGGWIVIDVGAHIGSFATACLARGAAFVLCVEPNRETFDVLSHNLAPFGGRAVCVRAAVWRSDKGHHDDRLCPSALPQNTGAATVAIGGDEEEVAAIPFDRLVLMAGGTVDFVKLDCEGSEWPILHTSTMLGACKRIVGEWHDLHAPTLQEMSPVTDVTYSVESLRALFGGGGFTIEMRPTSPGLGLFRFTR